MSATKAQRCEAITAQFAWFDQQCNQEAVAVTLDEFGSERPVCADHSPREHFATDLQPTPTHQENRS